MFFVIFWTALVRYTWLSNSSRFFFRQSVLSDVFGLNGRHHWQLRTMRCGRLPSRSDVNRSSFLCNTNDSHCPCSDAAPLFWQTEVVGSKRDCADRENLGTCTMIGPENVGPLVDQCAYHTACWLPQSCMPCTSKAYSNLSLHGSCQLEDRATSPSCSHRSLTV